RPLDRLTGAATKVAGGDLAVHLPVVGGGELGYVTEVFNDMVARLHESRKELERLSVTDDLTGLYNRRYLMDAVANEVRRSRRLNHPCTLLMADVDHFKEYNDAYGHLAGDEALRRIAGILRETTRDVDCAARYGGEEFVVLLPETRAVGAIETAQRFRTRLAADGLVGGKLSVSIGVAQFPEDGDAPDALLARADAALYRAEWRPTGRAEPAPADAGQALRLVRQVQRAAVVLLHEHGARLLEQRAGLRGVRAASRRRPGRGAQRLHRNLRFGDGRRGLRSAGDGLELRQRAHDLLPRLVQSRLQVLDLRIPLGQLQVETRDALLQH